MRSTSKASRNQASPTAALAISEQLINNELELVQSITFDRSLCAEINLSPALLSHICPLETVRGSRKCILLVSSKHRNSPELHETLKLLEHRKFSLDGGFGRSNIFVVLNEPLLHAIAKGQLDGQTASRMRSVHGDSSRSGYYQSFLDIIAYGVQNAASDVHLNILSERERSEVRYTIDDKYVAPERFKLPTAALIAIARVAYQRSEGGNGPEFNGLIEQQCRIHVSLPDLGSFMLRWASMACDTGPQITMRITRTDREFKPKSLPELGYLPSQVEIFERVMKSKGGAIIFSGVVNSGKSTSLTSLLSQIPSIRKVMTIEDPVENLLPGLHFHQNTVSRELDSDKNPFMPKVRTLKRTAFNHFFVGEIRDTQTGELLQDVIESGSSAYSTVHASNCVGIPARLASPAIGIARDVLATPGNFKLYVYQALLPVTCQHCRLPSSTVLEGDDIDPADAAHWRGYFGRIERLYGIGPEQIFLRNPLGCPHCRREGLPELNGFKGRTVVAELVEPDDMFNLLLREAKAIELTRYVESQRVSAYDDPDMTGKSAMDCAVYKMAQGLIDPREIEDHFKAFATVERERQVLEHLQKSANAHAIESKVSGGQA